MPSCASPRGLHGYTPTQRALAGFAELADRSEAGSGAAGRTWSRDDLHERSARP